MTTLTLQAALEFLTITITREAERYEVLKMDELLKILEKKSRLLSEHALQSLGKI